MALAQPALAAALEDALAAISAGALAGPELAGAFATYFEDATLNGIAVQSTPVHGTAASAMAAAMTFDPVTGTQASGAAAFVAGVTAFWGAIAASAATFWPTATTVTPPPALSGLPAALVAAFAANLTVATTAEAADNLATALHASRLGATGVIPPTTYPIS